MSLSLVTICWNSAATLRRCVESVLAQSYRPAEYVFVDGGSGDGTLALLQELCGHLERAGIRSRVLAQERRPGEAGIPSAWNQGIAAAGGEVIALLNSDDAYESAALQRVMDSFAADPACDAVVMPIVLVDGRRCRLLRPVSFSWLPLKMPLPHPGCFFRRRVYQQFGLYDTHYRISADYEFVCRCYRAGVRWQVLDAALVRMQAGGAALTHRSLARAETLRIARHYFPGSPLPWLAWLARLLTGR